MKTFLQIALASTILSCNFFQGSSSSSNLDAGASPPAPARVLTEDQYNNSIRDLFSLPLEADAWPELLSTDSGASGKESNERRWPWRFPPEEGVDGYVGMSLGQPSSPVRTEEYQKAAHYFAQYAFVSPTFFTCQDFLKISGDQQRVCAWSSLLRFVQRAYRRPMDQDGMARFQAFFDQSWANAKPQDAILAVVSGVLQSPRFIFRVERKAEGDDASQPGSLDHWDLAAKLAFFLWNSIPDRELFAAAATCDQVLAGDHQCKLDSPQEIAEQARRMLADPRAKPAVLKFHQQWLEIENIQDKIPARRAYGPLFGVPTTEGDDTTDDATWPTIVQALHLSWEKEAELFITKNIFDGNGKLSTLMSDHHGFFSEASKPIFGDGAKVIPGQSVQVKGVAGVLKKAEDLTLQAAEFPPTERAGVLTLPAVLAMQSHPVHPASVLRGVFINKRFLCREFGQPPAEAFGQEPSDSINAESTNRQRVSKITGPAPCASCHQSIDPPGFAFEHYDSVGQYRTMDNGVAVDAVGDMVIDGQSIQFKNGVELANALSMSSDVRECYARQWASYAVGTKLMADDPGLTPIVESFQQNDNIRDLLVTIASSGLFRKKKGSDQ